MYDVQYAAQYSRRKRDKLGKPLYDLAPRCLWVALRDIAGLLRLMGWENRSIHTPTSLEPPFHFSIVTNSELALPQSLL
jgi:hypothetical protein